MANYQTLQTSTWIMVLPHDWSQTESGDSASLYFQSADGTKGIYIATWNLSPKDTRDAEDVVEAFQVASLNSLKQMAGYEWQLVARHRDDTDWRCTAVTDLLAAEKCYRTVGKIIAEPPLVVHATFHDYACGDYQASREYFAPIIESLHLHAQDDFD